MTTEKTAGNSTYKKLAVQWLYKVSYFVSSSVLRINISAEKPAHRQYSAEPTIFYRIFDQLKKIIAISFLFVFLCANTELHQLLRLPVLIHHFLEHDDQEPDESFVDFLNEHYSDHHDHDNLPFKTTDCATAHVSLAFVNHIQFSIPRPTAFHDKITPIYNGTFYSSAVVSNIWKPPKIS